MLIEVDFGEGKDDIKADECRRACEVLIIHTVLSFRF